MSATAQLAIMPSLHRQAVSAIDADAAWRQLVARDARGGLFYAVVTTGVFCRIGCASRAPRRENVRFFRTADEAVAAGFRACARCRPTATSGNSLDEVRAYIESNLDRRVSLAELARIAGMSAFTVQRNFKKEFGASPLEYQRALRATKFRASLKDGERVTDAVYSAGFSSPSRAHEAAQLGMTPRRFAKGGKGERIGWAAAQTAFGWMIVGATERGLCWLALAGTKGDAEATLREEFPAAELRHDARLGNYIEDAIAFVSENAPQARSVTPRVDLRGTVFQLRVWDALRRIPRGETRSYSQLAREMGEPNSTRAVARACALNRVAVLVPCHRVVGVDGSLTGYRWGVERKRKLLDVERS